MPNLDPVQYPPRPAGPAGGGPTLRDVIGADKADYSFMICWRCGAQGYAGGPCTEKRGDGPPWEHQYVNRTQIIDPWARHGYGLEELIDLARYLAGKSMSSLATARAFRALVDNADRLGLSKRERDSHLFATALYADKAAKRTRLLDWAVDAIELRLEEGKGR